jgi:hypothetical protein
VTDPAAGNFSVDESILPFMKPLDVIIGKEESKLWHEKPLKVCACADCLRRGGLASLTRGLTAFWRMLRLFYFCSLS